MTLQGIIAPTLGATPIAKYSNFELPTPTVSCAEAHCDGTLDWLAGTF